MTVDTRTRIKDAMITGGALGGLIGILLVSQTWKRPARRGQGGCGLVFSALLATLFFLACSGLFWAFSLLS